MTPDRSGLRKAALNWPRNLPYAVAYPPESPYSSAIIPTIRSYRNSAPSSLLSAWPTNSPREWRPRPR